MACLSPAAKQNVSMSSLRISGLWSQAGRTHVASSVWVTLPTEGILHLAFWLGFIPFCHKCLGKPAHAVLMPASSFATPYGPTSRKKSLRERAQARPYWNPWQMACWEKLYPLLFLVNWWPGRCWTTLFCACPNFKWRHLLLWVGAALSSWVARIIEDIASPQPRL